MPDSARRIPRFLLPTLFLISCALLGPFLAYLLTNQSSSTLRAARLALHDDTGLTLPPDAQVLHFYDAINESPPRHHRTWIIRADNPFELPPMLERLRALYNTINAGSVRHELGRHIDPNLPGEPIASHARVWEHDGFECRAFVLRADNGFFITLDRYPASSIAPTP